MKRFLSLLIITWVASTVVAGGIDQSQGFTVGLANNVDLLGGLLSASSDNLLAVMNSQVASLPSLATATQDQAAFFSQIGGAGDSSSLLPAPEGIRDLVVQWQTIAGDIALRVQGQP